MKILNIGQSVAWQLNADVFVSMTLEYITPKVAADYLRCNINNRAKSLPRDKKYASAIRKGLWKITHQGIAFDASGVLCDGQTRLQAVVKSGKAVYMFVCRGLPQESRLYIDNMRSRSLAHNFSMANPGQKISQKNLSAARSLCFLYCHQHFHTPYGSGSVLFPEEVLLDFYQKHEDAIEASSPLCNVPGVGVATTRAAIACAAYHVSKHRLQEFVSCLKTGIPESRADIAAIAARNLLLDNKKAASGGGDRFVIIKKVSSALSAFVDGNPIKKLYAKDHSIYGLPYDPEFDRLTLLGE